MVTVVVVGDCTMSLLSLLFSFRFLKDKYEKAVAWNERTSLHNEAHDAYFCDLFQVL